MYAKVHKAAPGNSSTGNEGRSPDQRRAMMVTRTPISLLIIQISMWRSIRQAVTKTYAGQSDFAPLTTTGQITDLQTDIQLNW